jgi:hypothetical protein
MRLPLCVVAMAAALGACGAQRAGRPRGVAVNLEGGPNPGHYMDSVAVPTCTRGLVGPRSWDIQYSDWTGPRTGLRSLQLVVPAPDHPESFYLGMVFGDLFVGTVHEIDTRATAPVARGTGTITLRPVGTGTLVTLKGATKDDVAVSATIACQTPDSMEGTVP